MRLLGIVGRGLFLALILLASSSPLAVEPTQESDAEFLELEGAQLHIKVDRTMGLVPLKVKISGELRGKQRGAALAPEHHVFVEMESSHIRIIGGERHSSLDHGGVAEVDSSGVKDPMTRELVIHTPGTYHFRVIVRDEDGHEIVSNKVQVKAT
jgi:hypothetical protein